MSRALLRNYYHTKTKRAANYDAELQNLEAELAAVLDRYEALSHDEKLQALESVMSQERDFSEEQHQEYEPPTDVADEYGSLEGRISYSEGQNLLRRSKSALMNNYWDSKLSNR